MATKRFFEDSNDQDHPNDKRMKPTLASVIRKAVKMQNMHKLSEALEPFLEPFLKRVMSEEMDKAIRKSFPCSINRSPSLRIQVPNDQQPTFQLSFNNRVPLKTFTGSKILDIEGNPIKINLVEKTNNNLIVPTTLAYPIKLEIVVLDGDFPVHEKENWTSEEFNRKIVKERPGKRPLLAGELKLTMRDGIATIGDIEFTDNSSWTRSGKFRVAVKVIHLESNQSVRIQEAMTDAIVVRDHRGELDQKHYPPRLDDDLWRLKNIAKNGVFHKRMNSEGIKTVQDFLKLAVIDKPKLRKILGVGMSDKKWEVTLSHAKTCDMGSQGDQIVNHYPNNNQASVVTTYHENIPSYVPSNNAQMGGSVWSPYQGFATTSFAHDFSYGFSCLQSDEEMTTSGSGLSDIDGFTRHI